MLTAVMRRGGRLYKDGFGGRARLDGLVRDLWDYPASAEAPRIDVRWTGRAEDRSGIRHRRGTFVSPMAHLLPEESRVAHVELLLPVPTGRARSDVPAPVCLMLAATGEEGFVRRRLFAAPLVRAGIGALLLENPYYGRRRPRGQLGPALRTVADQFAMNTSTVEEARALLAWLVREGHAQVGATGYSQGGMMAAFAGALTPFEMAVIPRGAGASARPIFTESALAQTFDWKKLASEMRTRDEARRYFETCLEPVVVTRYPPPKAPELAVLLAARSDGFIPPSDVETLHRHWPGSELRWLDAGHVTAVLFHRSPHRRAVLDAFERLARRARATT